MRVRAVVWECGEGQTQMAVTNIHFASATPHAKCNSSCRLLLTFTIPKLGHDTRTHDPTWPGRNWWPSDVWPGDLVLAVMEDTWLSVLGPGAHWWWMLLLLLLLSVMTLMMVFVNCPVHSSQASLSSVSSPSHCNVRTVWRLVFVHCIVDAAVVRQCCVWNTTNTLIHVLFGFMAWSQWESTRDQHFTVMIVVSSTALSSRLCLFLATVYCLIKAFFCVWQ